jgi:molecular chaperone DnaJ
MVQGVLRGDPYDALGVPKDASSKVIKKAYRKLARANHPDRNPGDEVADLRFKITEAYEKITGKSKIVKPSDRGTFSNSSTTPSGFGGGIFGGPPEATGFRRKPPDMP